MTPFPIAAALAASLLVTGAAFAQTTPQAGPPTQTAEKQRTDGDGLPSIGPGSGAYKQQTDGDGPTSIGPGSGAYQQRAQSLSHGK